MSHVRTQIREAVRTLLEQIRDLQGQVVFDDSETVAASDSPWAHVALGAEQISPLSQAKTGGRVIQHSTALVVDLYTRGRGEAVEQAETLSAEVQTKLFDNKSLGGLVRAMALQAEEPDKSAAGSLPSQRIRKVWLLIYHTTERDLTTAI